MPPAAAGATRLAYTHQVVRRLLHRQLLWLWKVAPFPRWLRRAFIGLIAHRFLIGALAIVEDGQGRVLYVRQTYKRRRPWGLPGGWIKSAESIEAGLKREVAEETGLLVEPGPVAMVRAGPYGEVVIAYVCRVTGGGLAPDPLEVAELAYFSDDAPPDAEPLYLEIARSRRRAIEAGRPAEAGILAPTSGREQAMQEVVTTIVERLREVHRKLRDEVQDLDTAALNWAPGPDTNSLAVLVTHMLGSEAEALKRVRGLPSDRVRAAEFVPREQSAADLLARIDAAEAELEQHAAAITEADLAALRTHATRGTRTGLYWLVDIFGHLREHLGHLQLTRQLYSQQRQ